MNLIYKCRNCGEQKLVHLAGADSFEDAKTEIELLASCGDLYTTHQCVSPDSNTIGVADLIAVKPV